MTTIEARIRAGLATLEPLSIDLRDESGLHVGHAGAKEGGHYRLVVVSARFTGKPRIIGLPNAAVEIIPAIDLINGQWHDRKLHFKVVVDYDIIEDDWMRRYQIQYLRLNTLSGGMASAIVIPAVKDCEKVRDPIPRPTSAWNLIRRVQRGAPAAIPIAIEAISIRPART